MLRGLHHVMINIRLTNDTQNGIQNERLRFFFFFFDRHDVSLASAARFDLHPSFVRHITAVSQRESGSRYGRHGIIVQLVCTFCYISPRQACDNPTLRGRLLRGHVLVRYFTVRLVRYRENRVE